ncbi:hypothetical protein [Rothia sp. ZJ932]|uniref:hypothetical protein n=1 Tax=Rothia sp. ZJ932 TaxID=2810516 RepID=UPI0019683495|nr:hypothetical protein [Rothia sp. ZJ932]QRZ61991.1 hypothetical protein JR346_02360 [Rothia sp. ZJ932]
MSRSVKNFNISGAISLNRESSLPLKRQAIMLGVLALYLGAYSVLMYQQVSDLASHQAWTPFLVGIFFFAVLLSLTHLPRTQLVQGTQRKTDVTDLEGMGYFF